MDRLRVEVEGSRSEIRREFPVKDPNFQTLTNGGERCIELQVGMSFYELEDLFQFYKSYGRSKGFSVNKISGKKDANGDPQFITIGCHRGQKAGIYSKSGERQRPSRRIECKARLCASTQCDKKWRINKVILEHNHEMTPTKAKFMQQHREILPHVKRRLEVNDSARIRSYKTFRALVTEAGAYEMMGCSERDYRNHLGKVSKLQLVKGDAESIHQLFRRMQKRDRNFFYEISADKDGRMKNIMWVDARSQNAYKEFGDVSFDTTYLVNKYQMSFALFVSINHHGQSILLGCTLISNEKVSTFIWVFRQWVRCMDGVPPPAIITYQCPSIGKAIVIVFPEARHRWCLWHIMSKFPKEMKQYKQYDDIKKYFFKLVYDTPSIDEFEIGWDMMVECYNLHENSWVCALFEGRQKWAPVYVRRYFWGGMSITQRSESMNSYFDGYIHPRSTLKQFVDQYEVALMDKIEKEMHVYFECMNTKILTYTQYAIEKQLQAAYTHRVYVKVRKEFLKMVYCSISTPVPCANVLNYEVDCKVYIDESLWKRVTYEVIFDSSSHEIRNSCLLFESMAILCCHSLCVMLKNDVEVLPSCYILKRWGKDVKRCHSKLKSNIFGLQYSEEGQRVKVLEDLFNVVIDITSMKDSLFSVMCSDMRGLVTKLQILDRE